MPNDERVALARDVNALAEREFDVLVIGGGVHGLAIAHDAAQRGFSTALVERGDFGGAASFNHQKTAHGGLRSLQTGDLRRARESILERRALALIAPRFLRPMPFLIGTYRSITRSRLALAAAFRLDSLIGRGRNAGVEPELRLPAPRLLSRAAVLRLFPGVRREGLTGGASWYDYQIVETDRLTLGIALAAERDGAVLANHVRAETALREGSRIAGARVRDLLTGAELDVRARLTINAAGSHAGIVMGWFGVKREFPLLRAMNLVTRRRAGDLALAAPTSDGRMLTLTPWRGIAIIGTSQTETFVPHDAEAPDEDEVRAFIAAANDAFPALSLSRDGVTLVHRGVVPAERDRRGRPMLKRHGEVIDHRREGTPGAMTVIGVKYTTARGTAARAVDAAAALLGHHRTRSRTAEGVLPGASIADHEALAIEAEHRRGVSLTEQTRTHVTSLYGDRCLDVIEAVASDRTLGAALDPAGVAIGAEIAAAIRHEAARHLDDILMRRCTVGAGWWPGDALVERAADIAARELGWTPQARAEEVARLRSRYATVP